MDRTRPWENKVTQINRKEIDKLRNLVPFSLPILSAIGFVLTTSGLKSQIFSISFSTFNNLFFLSFIFASNEAISTSRISSKVCLISNFVSALFSISPGIFSSPGLCSLEATSRIWKSFHSYFIYSLIAIGVAISEAGNFSTSNLLLACEPLVSLFCLILIILFGCFGPSWKLMIYMISCLRLGKNLDYFLWASPES